MRWRTTLGGWNRRKAVLAAVGRVAVAAAAAALAVPLKQPWLGWAGVVVVIAAVAGLAVTVAQGRLEGKRERAELDRRVRVPVAPITDVDPTQIGVDPAAQTVLPGGPVPEYVARGIDTELAAAIEAALAGAGSWLVVVSGVSKVGKSRSLFEAMSSCSAADTLQLIAPRDGDALRSLLDPGQPMTARPRYAVLWLDDLEPFLAQGVTWQTLREWQSGRPGWIVAATYGAKGSDRVEAVTGLTTLAGQVLQNARGIDLAATSSQELDPLRGWLSDSEFDAVGDYGLAAYLVAGPALQRMLTSQRHAPGEPACPEGVAVVYAAVDWARCGRTDPIDADTLRALWPVFLPAGIAPDDERFDIGLGWALRPVAATIGLLQNSRGYRAYNYVTRLVRERPAAAPPPDPVWAAAIGSATAFEAYAVGVAACTHARLDDAAKAFTRARVSSTTELAANAGFNLGVVLGLLGRREEALAAWQRVIADYHDDPAPALREPVANALFNRGNTLGQLGRPHEALAAYQRLIADHHHDPDPALREPVANALFNQGNTLGQLGRLDEELTAYQRVIDDYHDDPAPALREQVANALCNQGVALGQLDRGEEALAACQRVIDDYHDDPDLREPVARARFGQGVLLGQLGRREEALAAYQRVIDDYHHDPAPALREEVAKALFGQGVVLGQLGRRREALTAYQRLVDDYHDDPDPALRKQVANALYNQGKVLGLLARPHKALTTFKRVIDDYHDDPALRGPVELATGAIRELRGEQRGPD